MRDLIPNDKLTKTNINRIITILAPIAKGEAMTVWVIKGKLTLTTGLPAEHPELKEICDYKFGWVGNEKTPASKEDVISFLAGSMHCQDVKRNAAAAAMEL